MKQTIRVMLVNDSLQALQILSLILSHDPNIQVVSKLTDPKQVVDSIKELKPDILCLDYFMPELNGIDLTKQIMAECPLPILVISDELPSKDCREIVEVLENGALDFMHQPKLPSVDPEGADKLLEKIRILSKVYVVKRKPAEDLSLKSQRKEKNLLIASLSLVPQQGDLPL